MAFGRKKEKRSTPQPDTSPVKGRGFFGRNKRPTSKAFIPPLDDDVAWKGAGEKVHDIQRGPFKDDQGKLHF